MRLYARFLLAFVFAAALGAQALAQTDPLPAWNDGPAKQAIVKFRPVGRAKFP